MKSAIYGPKIIKTVLKKRGKQYGEKVKETSLEYL